MNFMQERRVFDRLRNDISRKAQNEFEGAFNTLVERYNTTIRERGLRLVWEMWSTTCRECVF